MLELSPLREAPLETLFASNTGISDLVPLADVPLEILRCHGTRISVLTPLGGRDLMRLKIAGTNFLGIAPLEKCLKLKRLDVQGLNISVESPERLHNDLPNCRIPYDQEIKSSPAEPAAKCHG